jgi:ribosomal protein L11 methyltransferase
MKLKANPFAQAPRPVQIIVEAAPALLDTLEPLVEEWALAITRYIDAVVPHLVLLVDESQRELVEGLIAGAEPIEITRSVRVMKLDEIDWVAQVQKDFPPFRMGPFYVYGSHAREVLPRNHFPLLIDAASAFGTGEHATTAGCLLALAAEKKHRPYAQYVADVGCGTAILAIGARRLWKSARMVVCDNDPVAVDVSRHNLRVNKITARAQAFVSDGYKAYPMRRAGSQEVIVANILARPLMRMAKDAARQLAPGGTLILSGLLRTQEARVLSAHRMQGLYLRKHLRRGQWSVLVLK